MYEFVYSKKIRCSLRKLVKLAFVHDYLLTYGGAERVLQALHEMYPTAPIYTLFCDERIRGDYFPGADIRTSYLDRIPFRKSFRRWLLPLLPNAVESFDLRDYDVVLSSTSAFAKGVITRAHARHICYCHTPPRFLWEDESSYRRAHVARILRPFLIPLTHLLRLWDQHAAQRVDTFSANSRYTKERIHRYYRRDAEVVYPPVDVAEHPTVQHTRDRFRLPEEFFLSVGRLVWWKYPDLAIETFNRLGLPLIVVGEGPLRKKLQNRSRRNIRFLGWQPDEIVRELMHAASALIHPQIEDFGMAAVEAMAEGAPVVAFRRGGVLETIQEGVSGEFFDDQDPVSLADAVRRLRERRRGEGEYARNVIRASVQRFSREQFRQTIRREIENITP